LKEGHVSRIRHTATFSPDDSPARIREAFACPSCGHQDPGDAYLRITENTVRIFCSGCGSFITFTLTDDQADAIRRRSTTLSAIGQQPS
jgi:transcription elongation factor Elf1